MVEEANQGKLMVAEADRDKLGQRESGVRPWREGERAITPHPTVVHMENPSIDWERPCAK